MCCNKLNISTPSNPLITGVNNHHQQFIACRTFTLLYLYFYWIKGHENFLHYCQIWRYCKRNDMCSSDGVKRFDSALCRILPPWLTSDESPWLLQPSEITTCNTDGGHVSLVTVEKRSDCSNSQHWKENTGAQLHFFIDIVERPLRWRSSLWNFRDLFHCFIVQVSIWEGVVVSCRDGDLESSNTLTD